MWSVGSSFGGIIAFIFADLLVIPILDIYRNYYVIRMTAFLFITMYVSMAVSALVVEFIFQALGLVPGRHGTSVMQESIHFNYTTVLNIIFPALAAILVYRFFKTGGPAMLRMMSTSDSKKNVPHHSHS